MTFKSALFATTLAVGAALMLAPSAAQAGAYIFSGTDSDDHGGFSSGANESGWLFMQRALENLGSTVTTSNKIVVSLGSTSGGALEAATSAFTVSSLVSAGWSFVNIDGDTDVGSYLTGGTVGSTTLAGTGIIMLDSGDNVFGGLSSTEENLLTTNALALNGLLTAGGGIFSQANSYGFLSALLPGAGTVNGGSGSALTKTAAGNAAFPVLTDADLSTGPWHAYFTGIGSTPVLATAPLSGSRDVVIGAASGNIVTNAPEPVSMALLATGLVGLGLARRRRG